MRSGMVTRSGQVVAGPIRSVQQGTITISGAAVDSATGTLQTPVDPRSSLIHYLGVAPAGAATIASDGLAVVVLESDGITITASRGAGAHADDTTVAYLVVEYAQGIFRSIQAGSARKVGVGTQAYPLSPPVSERAFVVFGGYRTNDMAANSCISRDFGYLSLDTLAQTISATQGASGVDVFLYYQVADPF